MDITRENIEPFVDIPTSMVDRVDAWLASISATLTRRYSAYPVPNPDPVPASIAPAIYDLVAEAIKRRLPTPQSPGGRDPRVKAQAVAGASVQYFDSAQSTETLNGFDWASLDDLFGVGSVRSTRTPAPDAIRYGNLARNDEWLNAPTIPIESAI